MSFRDQAIADCKAHYTPELCASVCEHKVLLARDDLNFLQELRTVRFENECVNTGVEHIARTVEWNVGGVTTTLIFIAGVALAVGIAYWRVYRAKVVYDDF